MTPVRCSSCGQPAEWLVTVGYNGDRTGRVLAHCTDCRKGDIPTLVSVPLELVDENMFVDLYRLGYTGSTPDVAAEIVFGEPRPEAAARAQRHLDHFRT